MVSFLKNTPLNPKYFYNYANHKVPDTCHGWNTNGVSWPAHMWAAMYVFEEVYTHISICLHTTLCIHVCSWKMEGLGRVQMKCGSNLALCPHSSPASPFPWCFPWAIWSDEGGGFELGWGVRGEVYNGGVWDKVHNQLGTLLSNYSTLEEGGLGLWGAVAWPYAGVKCSVVLSVTDWRGHSCTWLAYTIVNVLSGLLGQAEWVCLESVGFSGQNKFY